VAIVTLCALVGPADPRRILGSSLILRSKVAFGKGCGPTVTRTLETGGGLCVRAKRRALACGDGVASPGTSYATPSV
jgi:hypothetical protein